MEPPPWRLPRHPGRPRGPRRLIDIARTATDAARGLRDADRKPRGRHAPRPDELREADLVVCEDTRRTRVLLDRHGVEAQLLSYHRHNEAARTSELVRRLADGRRVALVSDAGLPGINDPGSRLIAAAVAAGIGVSVLPGPSAVETALVLSGFGVDRYQFVGYLPRRPGALRALAQELARWPGAAVAFESPRRLPASLEVARGSACGASRRRLPGAHEALRGGLARDAPRARRPVLRAAAGRDHARARPAGGRAGCVCGRGGEGGGGRARCGRSVQADCVRRRREAHRVVAQDRASYRGSL